VSREGRVFVALQRSSAGARPMWVLGLDANGQPDFGTRTDGVVSINFNTFDTEQATALTFDETLGRLYVTGSGYDRTSCLHFRPSTGNQSLLAALAPDGTIDMSFRGDGKAVIDFTDSTTDVPVDIVMDGERVVTQLYGDHEVNGFGLFRYTIETGQSGQPCSAGSCDGVGRCLNEASRIAGRSRVKVCRP
jgi:hypothetical protein